MSGLRLRCAWMGSLFEHTSGFAAGQQVEVNDGGAFGGYLVAQRRGKRIDQPAFDAGVRDDALSLPAVRYACRVSERGNHRFERLAGEPRAEVFAPADVEAAIGRLQRGNQNPALFEQWYPCGIGTEPRPTAATEREYQPIRTNRMLTLRRSEAQRAVLLPAEPAMANVELDPRFSQAMQPFAQ